MLTERPITHGAILVRARPIGGLRLLDRGAADDKILAVLVDDPAFGHSARSPTCRARSSGAYDVIRAAIADYEAGFPPPA